MEHSVSAFDVPHNLRFSYVWDLPAGKGRALLGNAPRILDAIVGNWKLSGLGTIQSGAPIGIQNGSNSSGTNAGWPDGVGYIRPNILNGVDPINPNWRQNLNTPAATPDPYLNVAAFTPAARLTLGTMPRTASWLRSPNEFKYDMAIIKEFPVSERVRVALRAELFGALNHPFFAVASNTVTLYTTLDYTHYVMPPVLPSNYIAGFTNLAGASIGGTRTMQLGLKVYF